MPPSLPIKISLLRPLHWNHKNRSQLISLYDIFTIFKILYIMVFFFFVYFHSGVFVYIEASSPRVQGEKARLLSKYFPKTREQQCLSFFLHMYSQNKTMMGDFNVYLNDDNGKEQVLLQKSGSQAMNDWTKVQMMFKPVGTYQVISKKNLWCTSK